MCQEESFSEAFPGDSPLKHTAVKRRVEGLLHLFEAQSPKTNTTKGHNVPLLLFSQGAFQNPAVHIYRRAYMNICVDKYIDT